MANKQGRAQRRLESDITVVGTIWRRIQCCENWSSSCEKDLHEIITVINRIENNAEIAGFDITKELSRPLACILRYIGDEKKLPNTERSNQIELLISRLLKSLDQKEQLSYATSHVQTKNKNGSNEVFVVGGSTEEAMGLARQLERNDYSITIFPEIEGFKNAIEDRKPSAVMLDVAISGDGEGLKLVEHYQPGVPFMLFLDEDDFDARLAVAQAGGRGYMLKPYDTDELIAWLDRITGAALDNPFEILIIDDDPAIAESFAIMLGAVGMRADTLDDSRRILDALSATRPDVILLDIFMKGCSGVDLAKVIRQQKQFLSIPIMFMSSDTDAIKQYQAMVYGGDDVLQKPLSPEQIVLSVSNRAARARALRGVMEKDSLTGLLNHAMIKERLAQEIARYERTSQTMSFALLDIDKFKLVNDTHGHQVGDQVLKSLSAHLSRRLRKSDVIGRYGGEEFAIILNDTNAARASEVMNILRETFAEISHSAGQKFHYVTFSVGIAQWQKGMNVDDLVRQADDNLYRAKDRGRNRIVAD
jgi:diguanylate cyclase (GGDEF)-like protein